MPPFFMCSYQPQGYQQLPRENAQIAIRVVGSVQDVLGELNCLGACFFIH